MAEAAKQFQIVPSNDQKENGDLKTFIKNTHTEELIIGLCGPIGTDIHGVATSLEKILKEQFHYECQIIRLSDLIKRHAKGKSGFTFNENSSYYQLTDELINAGNFLRKQYASDILAEIAINEIGVKREEKRIEKMGNEPDADFTSLRICYIIDSIKNVEELELFKLIYRELFYSVGVFSPVEVREQNLKEKQLKEEEISKLINRDSGEEIQFGQKVADTFLRSDFFLRIENTSSAYIESRIKKYLHLIFSSEIITPTPEETAMYLASSAAGNSACLSRQVGAAITDKEGEVLAVGWNDVPKFGGGVYQAVNNDPLGQNDHRCMNKGGGKCFNDDEKKIIAEALIDEMIKENLIDESKKNIGISLIKKRSKIQDLIEFSRAVHAEMLAIILASQKSGNRMVGGKLFCTTYPCHNCARHIIASGIKEVYYIEPYRKSLAIRLHGDAITEDESKNNSVRILMFEGVSPTRYLDFFKMIPNSRKDNGLKLRKSLNLVKPKNTLSLQAIPILEKKVTESLQQKNLINV